MTYTHTNMSAHREPLTHTHSWSQAEKYSFYLGCSEGVIRIPSHATIVPIGLSNCLIRAVTGFTPLSNSLSNWLEGPGGHTGTWEVRGVIIVGNTEGREQEMVSAHKMVTETGDRWLSGDHITQRGEQKQCVLSRCRTDIHHWSDKWYLFLCVCMYVMTCWCLAGPHFFMRVNTLFHS